mgnify:CR=1 FL=1
MSCRLSLWAKQALAILGHPHNVVEQLPVGHARYLLRLPLMLSPIYGAPLRSQGIHPLVGMGQAYTNVLCFNSMHGQLLQLAICLACLTYDPPQFISVEHFFFEQQLG